LSIKAKLSLFISLIVTVILALNISIYYYSSKTELKDNAEQQMVTVAKQIGTSLDVAEKSKKYMEDTLGEKLRAVAIAAKNELGPKLANINNEQLVALAAKYGVDHISLWQRKGDDIVVMRSSEPGEIGLSSKTFDYWFVAYGQLIDKHEVTIPQGQKLKNFWSGPYQFSTTDPGVVNKFGYYNDGTTDYTINPYVKADVFLQYSDNVGTNALIRKLMHDNPDIKAITGFDPKFFGKPPILKLKKGKLVYNLDVRDIPFGEYTFKDTENDVTSVNYANQTRSIVTEIHTVNNQKVMTSFIPLSDGIPYIISVNFDYDAITRTLNHQLFLQAIISICLVFVAWISSYFIAGLMIRPLRHIMNNVNQIADGHFGDDIEIKRHDELGLLASRVNTMAYNLQSYMGKLRASAEELRSTKEYLESFVNHTSDAIHVTDLQGRITQVNDAFEEIYGWSREEIVNRELAAASIPNDKYLEYLEILKRIRQGESVAGYETVRHMQDGKSIDVSITVSPIRNDREEIVAVAEISRDISARKQTEEVIRRTEKLSVIGQLAAGVAHEIRNPLTTLRGFVQLHKQQGALSNEYLDIMLSELDRINFIVSEFLVLAKPQLVHYQVADVRISLQDMISLLELEAQMNNVQFEMRTRNDIPPLMCEINQLKQVILNLLKNGIEAMPDGGTITTELEYESGGNIVIIRIRDQGVGIPEEALSRLGEPFFSTKPTGNGLGLMVSQRIIANHKGTLQVTSELGRGTSVEIRLPVRGITSVQ
jgi:PAS domain S-box-containing protein